MNNYFGRLLTAMVTPFNESLEIDLEQAVELAGYLLSNGSDGLVLSGTTGEAPVLLRKEKIALYQVIVKEFGKDAVIAGTGGNNTGETVSLSREAERAGVGGIMVVAPYYNKPPQEGLYRHFKAVADSVSLPVILYNVPGRTGVNIAPETVLRLAETDNIVALKDASGNTDQASYIIENTPPGFAVYSGDDSLLIPFLSVGGYGVISVASHLAGLEIKTVIDLYVNNNNIEAARNYRNLLPLFKGLFITSNPIPVKEALNYLGFNVGGTRLPLVTMTAEQREEMINIISRYFYADNADKVYLDMT